MKIRGESGGMPARMGGGAGAASRGGKAPKKSKPLPPRSKTNLKPEPSSVTIKTDKNKLPSDVMRVGKINDKLASARKAAEAAKSSKRGLKAANKPLSKGNAKRVAEIKESTRFPSDKKRATEAFRTQNSWDKKVSPAQKALNKKLGK
jgi:hypothetical protein